MGEDEQRGRERNGSSRSLNVKQTNFNPTRGPHSSKDETEVRKRGGETPHLGVRGAVNTQTERLPGSMLFALMSDTRRSEVTGAHATGDRTALEPAENLTDVFLSLQMKNHLPSNPPPLPSPPPPASHLHLIQKALPLVSRSLHLLSAGEAGKPRRRSGEPIPFWLALHREAGLG